MGNDPGREPRTLGLGGFPPLNGGHVRLSRTVPDQPSDGPAPKRRSSDRHTAGLLTSVAVLGVAVGSIAWWWASPTSRLVGLPGMTLTSLGRATGLLAAVLLAAEVLLMARVPLLERNVGADWLALGHRWLGSYLFALVLAHVFLITWGYARSEQVGLATESERLIVSYPYILLAAIGTVVLAAVVTTSLPRIRPRLPHELWHLVHLTGLAAIALVYAHEVVDGAQFTTSAPARRCWLALHLAILALLVRYRILEPLRLSLRHQLVVSHVQPEPDGCATIIIRGTELGRVRARSGQFFRWRFLTRGLAVTAHPYSLSQPPTDSEFRITVKGVGDSSGRLTRLRPGTRVIAEGPYGAVTGRLTSGRRVALFAAGSGIAPMLALAADLAPSTEQLTLMYRVSCTEQAVLLEDLRILAAQPNVKVILVTGPRDDPRGEPLSRRALAHFIPDIASRDVFVCGPPALADRLTLALRALRVPPRRIHQEQFSI